MASGTVTDFDEAVGLGVIKDDDGVRLTFHCTAIADGTRTIEVGAAVTFKLAAGPMGRWEARSIKAADE